ncbi:MAG: CBS domain-containing protein, partial [Spirulinaceae cyanobacterium]
KLAELVEKLKQQIPFPLTAKDLMSSPVRTIRPETTIEQAQSILLRYGHSGLCVVDVSDKLVGIISRRDIDLSLHHGFAHAPVKGYMSSNLKTVTPETTSGEIELLMVTYDVGRLPVLKDEQLMGIVTRTDILRQHQGGQLEKDQEETSNSSPIAFLLPSNAQSLISQPILEFLDLASSEAQKRGWNLYLVGGAVRDLLLRQQNEEDPQNISPLQDIDLVVDGFHEAANANAGVELAKALQTEFPNCRLEIHGAFQTAALLWHHDSHLGNLWVDIATARTEFYPYPAANPVVEASSIRQDLYRRDFTINALALKLTNSKTGELLDFFGGLLDLESRQIKVLHPNSFIEDPTRIYRAVRFAVRLGFSIETQTESYIRYAIDSGVYERSQAENDTTPALTTRLKAELKYILQAPYWKRSLQVLQSLEALRCLHPNLKLDPELWWQIRLIDRCLRKFDPDDSLNHWLMRLELILARLPGETSSKVATNLQLPLTTVQRLQNLTSVERTIVEELSRNSLLPSQVVKLLRQYKLPTLALLAVKTPRQIRKQIWQYLTQWRNVESLLNGNDLKALGYQPGPQYSQILDTLLTAKLDGKISDRAEAEDYLRSNYS